MTLEVKYKAIREAKGKKVKMLKLKQIIQKLLAKINVGNTSDNLLSEIRKIVSLLYRAKKSLKNYIIMSGISMNSNNSERSYQPVVYYLISPIKQTREKAVKVLSNLNID